MNFTLVNHVDRDKLKFVVLCLWNEANLLCISIRLARCFIWKEAERLLCFPEKSLAEYIQITLGPAENLNLKA